MRFADTKYSYSWRLGFDEIFHKAPPPSRDHAQVNDHVSGLSALLLERILGHGDLQIHHDPMIDSVLKWRPSQVN